MDNAIRIGSSHADCNIEKSVVDGQVSLFGCDIGNRPIDIHATALNDAGGNHGDVTAAIVERIDLRTIFDNDR